MLCLPDARAGELDADPDPGQSWLSSYSATTVASGRSVSGRLRSGDNFGAVTDRDFSLAISGSTSAGNREVLMRRFEPECLRLAAIARLSANEFCDQLTLKYRNAGIDLSFFSHDANKRYQFTLNPVPGNAGAWQSIVVFGASAPQLSLNVVRVSTGYRYDWSLAGAGNRYSQSLLLSDAILRDMQLSATEGALVALGDVLRSFNSYEFQRSDLVKTHPDYKPTPYSGWAENPDSGCVFLFCFGDLGGGGGSGGGSNSGGQCNPGSSNFDPTVCPWDLTYAIWPISQRVKIWKLDNDHFGYSLSLNNKGPGSFRAPSYDITFARTAFISLIQLGATQPLVSATQTATECNKTEKLGDLTVNPFEFVSQFLFAGSLQPFFDLNVTCSAASGRPPGRYRLYVHIDPDDRLDYSPGWGGNNIGNSGAFDWVNLKR